MDHIRHARPKNQALALFTVSAFTFSTSATAAAVDPSSVFEPIKDRDPYAYVVGVVMFLGLVALMAFLRTLWTKNERLHTEKDELHESKLKFALDAAATMKEAVQIVQAVNEKLEPMIQGDLERREFQKLITMKIETMERNLAEKLHDMKAQLTR
jgi:hypothetical protein